MIQATRRHAADQFNSSTPGQKGCPFTDEIFKCIFMTEKLCILIQISLKFVHKGLIQNDLALVQVMAKCQTGNKPLSKPMQPQFTDASMQH